MEAAVYIVTGFLESGKTRFMQEMLADDGFSEGERTLLLVCEEGEEEYDPELLKKVYAIVHDCANKEWAKCRCEVVDQWNRDTVYWDKTLVGYVRESAEELGIPHMDIHSGAGHDAQFAAYMLPTTMIFVSSEKGLSHCEPEHTSDEICTDGASVLLNAVLKCDAAD